MQSREPFFLGQTSTLYFTRSFSWIRHIFVLTKYRDKSPFCKHEWARDHQLSAVRSTRCTLIYFQMDQYPQHPSRNGVYLHHRIHPSLGCRMDWSMRHPTRLICLVRLFSLLVSDPASLMQEAAQNMLRYETTLIRPTDAASRRRSRQQRIAQQTKE